MEVGIDYIKELWKNNLDSKWFQVYINSPFCSSLCNFCAYKGCLYNKEIAEIFYNDYLLNRIKELKEIIASRKVDAYYFGGGTPSLMTCNQMIKIFSSIPNFEDVGNKYFEAHPASMDIDKLKVLHDFNFQTITFGIQSFNKESLLKSNRPYRQISYIKKIIYEAKKLGLKIGIDLLFWENNKNLAKDINLANDIGADMIFTAVDYKVKNLSYIIDSFSKEIEVSCGIPFDKVRYEITRGNNLHLYNNDIVYSIPGVFEYCSDFSRPLFNTVTTMGIGSFGTSMPMSNIGKEVTYKEINDNWTARFNVSHRFKWETR